MWKVSERELRLFESDIEWHVVPCIDPDAARLNEGWTQQKYSVEKFMKGFYKQLFSEQSDFSFPMDYKGKKFDAMTIEAKVLKKIFDDVRPDFYYTLHNAMIGGSYFFITPYPLKDKYCSQLREILADHGLPQRSHVSAGPKTSGENGIYAITNTRQTYDAIENSGIDGRLIKEMIDSGEMSHDYLSSINGSAVTFVAELSCVKHPLMNSSDTTDDWIRHELLKAEADNKFLMAMLVESWDEVEDDLNKFSPFFNKVYSNVNAAKKHLHDFIPYSTLKPSKYLLSSSEYQGRAKNNYKFDVCMTHKFSFLCHHYGFVRLLKDSKKTQSIVSWIDKLETIFDKLLFEISKQVDFSKFEIIDVNTLAKVQLGSGLIVINSILEEKESKIAGNQAVGV